MENRFKPGDIVQHFKREMLDFEERNTDKYLYEIIGVATHSETREPMMVYKPLYDDSGMYVRPLDMFLSEVDHDKYPDVEQEYRFEKVPGVPMYYANDTDTCAGSNGHEYVDLGLSVIWAAMNIGAASGSDFGDRFAWGETAAKDEYSWSTYKYGSSADALTKYNTADNRRELEADDDAAAVNWGGTWHVPTEADWEELCDPANCKWEWTRVGDAAGYRVTSKKPGYTDKTIFLPTGGYCLGREVKGAGSAGYYWSALRNGPFRERAICLHFLEKFVGIGNNGFRTCGFTVRPVMTK